MKRNSVAAIIPAYNEARTVGRVVQAVKSVPAVSEVIVVNDGSGDRTHAAAESAGAKVITISPNQGKGKAMSVGVSLTDAKIILFVDADFVNLTPEHIEKILRPVLENEYDMVTGMVDRGKSINKIMGSIEKNPFAGLRALKREIWDKTPQEFKEGYVVDSGLHVTASRADKRIKNIILENLKQITKTKKYGLTKGIFLYIKMWGEIAVRAVQFLWIK